MTLYPLNILMGFLAGLLCSLGGALKDSPYEGFKPLVFTRSLWVGLAGGVVSCLLTTNLFLAFTFSGYFERAVVEGWKIIRHKKPGKFDHANFDHAVGLKHVYYRLVNGRHVSYPPDYTPPTPGYIAGKVGGHVR
jgi:hypothetical protein